MLKGSKGGILGRWRQFQSEESEETNSWTVRRSFELVLAVTLTELACSHPDQPVNAR